MAAPFGKRGEHHHTNHRSAIPQSTQRVHAVHYRHLDVESHSIWLQPVNLLQSDLSVRCCTNYLNADNLAKKLLNESSHHGGVVHDQDPYRVIRCA